MKEEKVKNLVIFFKAIAQNIVYNNTMIKRIIECQLILKESDDDYNQLSNARDVLIHLKSRFGENAPLNHIAKESSSDGSVSLLNKLLSAVSKIIRGDFSVSSRYVYNLSDDASDTIDRSVFLSFIKNEIAILESMQLKFGCLSIYEKGLINRLSILMK